MLRIFVRAHDALPLRVDDGERVRLFHSLRIDGPSRVVAGRRQMSDGSFVSVWIETEANIEGKPHGHS